MCPQRDVKDQEYDYFYNDEQDEKYCYSGTYILKNKLDIRELDILHEAERDYTSVRQAELINKCIIGDFSFNIFVQYINSYYKIFIYGLGRQEPLIFQKELFFA